MVHKTEVMPLLLETCPSFYDKWAEHRKYRNEEQFMYEDLTALAHHVVELLREGKTEEFSSIFEVVERLIIEGDDEVQEAIVIGLLEDIQNISLNTKLDPERFVTYLKPQTIYWWNQLNDFWSCKIKRV